MSQYLGDISAYALAVSQGYTGTEEEYAELMASYATVGQTAVTAAQTATTKASEAATSATTATNKASEATTAATTATTKAGEASTSASTATSAKDTAVSASQTATTKASEATTAAATATSAKTDAVAANTAAQSAKTAAQTAQTGAETAAASVEASAAQIQTNADDISELKEELINGLELTNNKNLANPNDPNFKEGAYVKSDGTYTESALFNTTGFIPVKGGEKIVGSFTENGARADAYLRFMCCYDAAKTPIPSKYVSTESKTYTVPSDVAFVRISIAARYWNELMLEFGIARTPYIAPNNIFTPIRLADESVSAEMLKDRKVVDGYNLTPIGESGIGYWYVSGGQLVFANTGGYANYRYYKVPIDENSMYSFSGTVRAVVTTDNSGVVKDSMVNSYYTEAQATSGATVMYVTYDPTANPNGVAICKGYETTTETKYTAEWLGVNFGERSIKGIAIANRAYCSIPKIIYMNTSEAIKIYLDDILSQKGSYFWCNSVSGLTTYIDEEYLQITCTTAGSYSLKWAVYDSNLQKIDEGTSTVKVSALSALASKKALVLGDSFVAYGGLSQALMDAFTDQGKTLTLIGTRGTAPNLHEGRGGWSADSYCNYASMGEFTNPFYYNDTFDFAYYMSQNGYSDLDYVFINLGINKVFGQNFATYPNNIPYDLECYMDIIESIHNYDTNIKIFCNLPTPPNTQNGKFSQAYGTSQMLWLYANNIKHYAKDMIDNISGTNVYIVGTNFAFDTDTDIFDGVHPTSAGYPILAKAMVNAVIGN